MPASSGPAVAAAPARPRVLVTRRLPGPVEEAFGGGAEVVYGRDSGALPRAALLSAIADADALVCLVTDRVDAELLAAAPRLRVVSNVAVGVDNIDLAACGARGIVVCNTPGVLSGATADLAFGLLLGAARRICEGDRLLHARTPWHWDIDMMLGAEVHGGTVGIVGFGRIGRAFARRARGFEMRVLYHARHRAEASVEAELGLAPDAYHPELDTLLSRAEFVSLHVPLTPQTHHLFDAARLARMRRGAILVNTARGAVVDEEALVAALRSGHLGGAGLDVFEHEPRVHPGLLELPNVALAPHLGSATARTRGRMVALAARNAAAVLRGEAPPHRVV